MLIMNKGPEDEKSFSDEGDEDDSHARTGSRDIVLELDDDNLPLIPEYNNQVLAVRKEIIRKYVTGHYSKSLLSMKGLQQLWHQFCLPGTETINLAFWRVLQMGSGKVISLQ